LPETFPYRDFIQVSAFVVVLGTLLLQGLTLRRPIDLVRLEPDDTVNAEIGVARETVLEAVLARLVGENDPAAERLREEYRDALLRARGGQSAGSNAERSSPEHGLGGP
jgi:CPA1 family monovalent cation:H+ antiporter